MVAEVIRTTFRAMALLIGAPVVSYTATANDLVSGSAEVTCTPQSGTQFPIGATTVSCSASDWVPNLATGSFTVTILDRTPPTLSLPAAFALDATGPSGAVANYQASATDAPRPEVVLWRAPLPPAPEFPIGTTNVSCTATDVVGNPAQGQFDITVRGASDQVAALRTYVQAQTMAAALKRRLLSTLNAAANAAASGRSSACQQLASVASIVQGAGNRLSPAQAERILTDVARIRAVLGC